MTDLSSFIAGTATGAVAMSAIAIYVGRGWHQAINQRDHIQRHLDDALDKYLSEARSSQNSRIALGYACERITTHGATIAEMTPLAEKGRKLIARRKKQDADRRVARAKKAVGK